MRDEVRRASPPAAVVDPLAGSITNSTTTWATAAMGKHDGQFDLFWQLWTLDAATGHLALVTPPGVASNGGLMVGQASEGASALVGFGVSQDLLFSPLALSTNDGRDWTPGGLEQGLATVPSAIALGEHGDAFAVVGGSAPAVLRRSGALTSWRSDVTRDALAATAAGRRCQVGVIDGVSVGPGDSALVGASCRSEGVPGIFERDGSSWRLLTLSVPQMLERDAFDVLRLAPSSALLGAAGHASSVVAAWMTGVSGQWSLSPALTLPSPGALVATGTGTGGREFVLFRAGATERADVVDGPGRRWQPLPSLPAKTATLAFLPDGRIEAVSVDDTRLGVWQLDAAGRSWAKAQAMTVPISFGSSS